MIFALYRYCSEIIIIIIMILALYQFLILAERADRTRVYATQVHYKTRVPQYQSKAGGQWHDVLSRTDLPFDPPMGVSYR